MTEASRHNEGKPQLSQLHHFKAGLEALAEHCTAGRGKYPDVDGVPNWTLGGKPDSEYLDAAERHLGAIVRGETHDVETGTLHAAAVAWNMLALITLNYEDTQRRKHENLLMRFDRRRFEDVVADNQEIAALDWYQLGARERTRARSAGFVERLDGRAVRGAR